MKVQAFVASALLASGTSAGVLIKRDITITPTDLTQIGSWKCGDQNIKAEAIVQAAKAAVLNFDKPIISTASNTGNEFPHEFRNDGNEVAFPRCTGPFTEYPFLGLNQVWNGQRAGKMRVVVQVAQSGKDGSAEFCGMMFHAFKTGDDPATRDSFTLCTQVPPKTTTTPNPNP